MSYQDLEDIGCVILCAYLASCVLFLIIKRVCARARSIRIARWQENVMGIGLVTVGAIAVICWQTEEQGTNGLLINEICSNNESIATNQKNEITDFVELYNPGILSCELDEMWLSDDEQNYHKMSLKGMVVKPGEVLLISLEKQKNSFALSKSGESIYLTHENGTVIDSVSYPALEEDMSYARKVGDVEEWYVMTCTPDETNEEAEITLNAPVFTAQSGFYEEAFFVAIQAAKDMKVYYSLDGSIPTEDDFLYEEPIYVYDRSAEKNVFRSTKNVVKDWKNYEPDETPVDKAYIIRAIAMDEEGNVSEPTTVTYFVGLEQYRDKKVVSLIAEPEELFGGNGLYVTGEEYDEWYLAGKIGEQPSANYEKGLEKEAVIELFHGDSILL